MNELNEAWSNFCENETTPNLFDLNIIPDKTEMNTEVIPKSSDLYISTQTKISYLNTKIDLKPVFWELPILEYHQYQEGILKKQMKFNTSSQNELDELHLHTQRYDYVEENIITHIDNPVGRIRFKDIRKISIGLCKKDILSYRCKKKSAFYNCFVAIMRIKINNTFKEIHVKVFNTGKLEIPGIQDDQSLYRTLDVLTNILSNIPHNKNKNKIYYLPDKNETVLINSNFICGYYINRDKLYNVLRHKYKINVGYDPCSYPGLQCEFYYDESSKIQTGKPSYTENEIKMSFMIFRTGSVLIVGKCTETILYHIYEFLKKLLYDEFYEIRSDLYIPNDNNIGKKKKKKIKKKQILISV